MAERDPRPQDARRNPERGAAVANIADQELPLAPESPGGNRSPQHPGQVPDHTALPGRPNRGVPRPRQILRPLSEQGTSQGIMGVYQAAPGQEMDPSRFEQATATYEELRKAYPAQLPPTRPTPGYFLTHGDRMASEGQAVEAPQAVPSIPANTASGTATARPGGGTAELGAPTRAEVATGSAVGAAVGTGSDTAAAAGAPATGPAGDAPRADSVPAPGDMKSVAGNLSAEKPNAPSGPSEKGGPGEAPQ